MRVSVVRPVRHGFVMAIARGARPDRRGGDQPERRPGAVRRGARFGGLLPNLVRAKARRTKRSPVLDGQQLVNRRGRVPDRVPERVHFGRQ